jgi:hypothetical protein
MLLQGTPPKLQDSEKILWFMCNDIYVEITGSVKKKEECRAALLESD